MDINIFCNESINLQDDNTFAMIAGAISCPKDKLDYINQCIYEIKVKHGLQSTAELKWTKVSESKYEMYEELAALFFDNAFLSFRAVVALKKEPKNWYKRTFYMTFRDMLDVNNVYRIMMDAQDVNDEKQLTRMNNIVHTAAGYFYEDIVKNVQLVDAQQHQLLQLADIFIGAVAYVNRGLTANTAKMKLIDYIESNSGVFLSKTTPKVQVQNKVSIYRL